MFDALALRRVSFPFAIATALCLVSFFDTSARTWTVDDDGGADFTSVQEAILAANHGDVVEVAPGHYFDRLFYGGRRITVRSTHGPGVTILDAMDTGSVVTMTFGENTDAVLEGFTVTGGRGTPINAPGGPLPIGELPGDGGGREGGDNGGGGSGGNGVRSARERSGEESADALTYGGGILLLQTGPSLRNLIIEGNHANRGGGLWGYNSATVIEGCTFRDNVAGEGGAIAFEEGSSAEVRRSAMSGHNTASGGAVWLSSSAVTFLECRFSENTAGDGGGVYVLGGLHASRFERCTFWKNGAGQGSALFVREGRAGIVNCTLVANGFEDFDPGAVFLMGGSNVSLERSILAENTSLAPTYCLDSTLSAACNDYWPAPLTGGGACPPGANAFSLDPLFCASEAGDFRLRADSPCLSENAPGSCGGVGASGTRCGDPNDSVGGHGNVEGAPRR